MVNVSALFHTGSVDTINGSTQFGCGDNIEVSALAVRVECASREASKLNEVFERYAR